jgi:hypothetical protein
MNEAFELFDERVAIFFISQIAQGERQEFFRVDVNPTHLENPESRKNGRSAVRIAK